MSGSAAPRPARVRADVLLVERGFYASRARARAAIEAGCVSADGSQVESPSSRLPAEAAITAGEPHPWVSRGGIKLAAALDAFAIDPAGLECLDVGASTGGFTDVLLARGAARVHAVDNGRGQLHPKLAADPRVHALEARDVRRLQGLIQPSSIDLATVDVSFISLRLVLPELTFALKQGAQVVALVKPQFEVGRAGLGRGGLVRDPDLAQAAADRIAALMSELGYAARGPIPSPIAGGDGNREYLVAGRRG